MDSVQPILVLAGRVVLGALLAVVLSVLGVGVAWGLFIFSGTQSLAAMLTFLTTGAGVGAGLGGFLAWLRIDGDASSVLLATALVALAAGIGGAWVGYEFGSHQEVKCCARPEISPVMYIALGATVVTNAALMAVALGRSAALRTHQMRMKNRAV